MIAAACFGAINIGKTSSGPTTSAMIVINDTRHSHAFRFRSANCAVELGLRKRGGPS